MARKFRYKDLSPAWKRIYQGTSKEGRKLVLAEAQKQYARALRRSPVQKRSQAALDRARTKYRPPKKARGSIRIISATGQDISKSKTRKGFPFMVSKTGRVTYVGLKGEAPRARKVSDIKLPFRPNLRRMVKAFYQGREHKPKTVAKGKALPLLKHEAKGRHWKSASKKIAATLKQRFDEQAGHRDFVVRVALTVRSRETGEQHVINFDAPVAKPANVKVPLAHMQHFVDHVVYAYMARELAYLGLVTAGSANSVRRLPENEGLDPDEWVDAMGNPWAGRGLSIVDIEEAQWRIVQMH